MIWLILLLAIILRSVNLNQSLWLDEAIIVQATKNYNFVDVLTIYSKADFHPPGYLAMLWLWAKVFGTSEIAVRVPSVIFGSFTVLIIFLIAKEIFSAKLGLLSAFLLAINPLHIYYSQEARMYVFASFFAAVNFLFFIRLLLEKKWFVGYLLSALLVLISDYLAYFIFPAQLLTLYLCSQSRKIVKMFMALIPAGLFLILWLPIFFEQLKIGGQSIAEIPTWKGIVGSSGVKPVLLTFIKFVIGRISHPDKIVYYSILWLIGVFYVLLIVRFLQKGALFTKKVIIPWITFPIILVSFISLFIPVYSYFRMLYLVIPFTILVSLSVITLKKRLLFSTGILIFLISITSSIIYLINPTYQREDWRGLTSFLEQQSQDGAIIFESTGSFPPYDYYSRSKVYLFGGLNKIPAKDVSDLINMEEKLVGINKVYLLDYLVDVTDPDRILLRKLESLGFQEKVIKNFIGVGFVRFYERGLNES